MPPRRSMLWAALLLSCSANVSADRRHPREGGAVRRRKRRPQTHDRRHAIALNPDHHHAGLHPTYRRLSTDCKFNEQPFVLNFQTDSYGSETSWFLRSDNDGHGDYIGWGPPTGISYGDFTLYSFSYCLDIGSTYTLAMEDNFGDGMCCSRGHGGYEYLLGGVRLYSTQLKDVATFRDYVEHTFTVEGQYSPMPTEQPTSEAEMEGERECVANPGECGCANVEQEDYRGTLATTENGRTCQAWSVTTPHEHEYAASEFANMDLTQNYCRSPDGGRPWCLTTDPDVVWEFCRIPTCPTVVKVKTQEPTSSTTQFPTGTGPTTPRPTLSPVAGPTPLPSMSPTKSPTNEPTPQPTSRPTPDRTVFNPANGCYGGDVKMFIEVRADEYSTDTSWELFYPNKTRALHQAEASFGVMEYKSSEICLPHGNYTFIIKDKYGDGMCCRYGEGLFRIHLDDRVILNGGNYNENVTATINVGFNPDGYMTEREFQYLESHNIRRKEWHEMYNLTYVPMVYSTGLAKSSKAWAEELLHACGIVGIEHEDHNPFGENLAKNTGNPLTWGQLYHPDKIVNRWVEFEIGLPYPSNGHLTQALWRASMYLGCGESVKQHRGGLCRVQVCRYGRAGNCDMTRYNSTTGENWLIPMLDNYTRCGPDCPPEGCN
eukprot:CAMPEP_0172301006 /NCGR_PEP_ID=MMETSP1058-20130122/2990_1 /TAXON_ID=83371 /ORGANISM="Detonula confervacea, Strain CCMP 353" /LENGTH=656 /DNA_ID=CAMNT_0013010991 /DNA_START=79 /DNA_END=2049 /DNA_ORIENTATION=+